MSYPTSAPARRRALAIARLRAGRKKVHEDGRVVQRAAAHLVKLGVPLRGGDVAGAPARAPADGLGHAVRVAPGLDLEAGRQALDALVVDAVDARAQHAGVQLRQAGVLFDVDFVEVLVVSPRVAVA